MAVLNSLSQFDTQATLNRDSRVLPTALTSAARFAAGAFMAQGLISEDQKDAIVAQAAESSCGAKSMQGTNTITAVLTPRCAQ